MRTSATPASIEIVTRSDMGRVSQTPRPPAPPRGGDASLSLGLSAWCRLRVCLPGGTRSEQRQQRKLHGQAEGVSLEGGRDDQGSGGQDQGQGRRSWPARRRTRAKTSPARRQTRPARPWTRAKTSPARRARRCGAAPTQRPMGPRRPRTTSKARPRTWPARPRARPSRPRARPRVRPRRPRARSKVPPTRPAAQPRRPRPRLKRGEGSGQPRQERLTGASGLAGAPQRR